MSQSEKPRFWDAGSIPQDYDRGKRLKFKKALAERCKWYQ